MSETKTVHECLFCPQTFGSAVEKDDHILEHFAQETCTDCDQSLIRIGSNLYTLHNAVTCIKRKSKLDVSIQNDIHRRSINQNHNERDCNATFDSSNIIFDQQLNIKLEPSMEQNEQLMSVEPMNFAETSSIENYQGINNPNSNENIFAIDVTPSNTVSVREIEIKMEPEVQFDQLISTGDVNNTTESNDMDFGSSQVFQSQSSATRTRTQKIFKCDFCSNVFLSKKSLSHHQSLCCKRDKKSLKETPGDDVASIESDQIDDGNRENSKKDGFCNICNKFFYNKSGANKHKFEVHKIGGHPCINCKQVFFSTRALQIHDCEMAKKTYECYICHKGSKAIKSLRFHILTLHISSKRKFNCAICGIGFHYLNSYEDHKNRQHLNVGDCNFVCSTCGRTLKSKISLIQHENIHSGAKPFQCTYQGCNETFRSYATRYIHIRRFHQGHKKYRCRIDDCNEQFGGQSGFKKHKLNAHGIPITK